MSRLRSMDIDEVSTARLRAAMADRLRELGAIGDRRLADAFATVPRHLFTPEHPPEAAYALDTAYDDPVSPRTRAILLDQARPEPGMRCLAIGADGYTAALLAELTGPHGRVTCVSADPGPLDHAARHLAAAGYPGVDLVLGDPERGVPGYAPYDRVIVLTAAWDIPPAWIDQLADGGTLTLPLRLRGLTRSLTLEREDRHLVARSVRFCGSPAPGPGARPDRVLSLRGGEIALRFDEDRPCGDGPPAPEEVFGEPRAEAWSGVRMAPGKPFDLLELWLATMLDGFGLLWVDPARDTGLVAPAHRYGCPATAGAGGLAHLAVRHGRHVIEFGAHAYGPQAPLLAETFTELIRVWDRDHRGGPGPRVTVHPLGPADLADPAPDDVPCCLETRLPGGLVVTRRHVRVAVSWPSPTCPGTAPHRLRGPLGRC